MICGNNKTHLARVVDESCITSCLRCINHTVRIKTKQITASDTLFLVTLLSDFGSNRTNHLADILTNEFLSDDWFTSEQAPIVNVRASEFQRSLPHLE